MPRITIDAGDFSDVKAAEGFSNYSGPTPPRGVYHTKTGLFRLVTNNSGDKMFKIVFEIAEPKSSDKAKFNGYAIWHNANVTKQGAPYLNALLDALGLDRKAVWAGANGGIVTFQDKPEDVKKIGGRAVKGLSVLVTTTRENYPKGSDEWKLVASSFAADKGSPAVDPDDDAAEPVDPDEADEGGSTVDPDEADDDGDSF